MTIKKILLATTFAMLFVQPSLAKSYYKGTVVSCNVINGSKSTVLLDKKLQNKNDILNYIDNNPQKCVIRAIVPVQSKFYSHESKYKKEVVQEDFESLTQCLDETETFTTNVIINNPTNARLMAFCSKEDKPSPDFKRKEKYVPKSKNDEGLPEE